jgi:hypothetical protein
MIITFANFCSSLNEAFLNLWSVEEREKYKTQIFKMITDAYAYIGGYAGDLEELVTNSLLWKCVVRNEKIVSVVIYKDKHGRKLVALASDGSDEGKKGLIKILTEDITLQRSWSELSGKLETLSKKLGMRLIPAKFAPLLTGKNIISYSDDGFHYTRLIGGEEHEKSLFGHPKTGEFVEVDV